MYFKIMISGWFVLLGVFLLIVVYELLRSAKFYINDSKYESSFIGIFLDSQTLFNDHSRCANGFLYIATGFFVWCVWPLACLVLLGYYIIKGLRFITRTKKKFEIVFNFLHSHPKSVKQTKANLI